MTIQITKLVSFLIPFTIILISYFYFSFLTTRKSESEKLKALSTEINLEKNIKIQLKNISKELEELNKHTQNKLLQIKIGIFNIDFTLSEMF